MASRYFLKSVASDSRVCSWLFTRPPVGSFTVGLAVAKYTLCNRSRASSTLSTTGAGGGGGLFTVTELVVEAVKPRESVQVVFMVAVPAEAPVVESVAELPLPETLPALEVQLLIVTVALSGLVQIQLIVDDVPISTVAGLAEQEICGGFSGFTVKLELQLAVLFFFALGSVTVAVAA